VEAEQDRVVDIQEEVSEWPILKVARARQLTSELNASMSLWRHTLGSESRAVLSQDRRDVVFYARIAHEPPLYEWSLLFGDIIHNYRTALDGLAWGLAHLDGNAPAQAVAKRVAFPFATTRDEWQRIMRTTLASVPLFMLYRLDCVQPYHGENAVEGIGVLLHALDIIDKHKASIATALIAADKTSFGTKFRPVDPDADLSDSSSLGEFEWVAPESGLRDGDEVARIKGSVPLQDVSIDTLPLSFTVELNGKQEDAHKLLDLIDRQVCATFLVVEHGPDSQEWITWIRSVKEMQGE
jgi:hypothetical protein